MKRIIALCLLALFPPMAMAQLPDNFSYGKYLTSVEDQLRQGPCESFASVGGVEAFYNLSYAGPATVTPINLSEREVYNCGGSPTKGLDSALRYIRDKGVIPRGCFEMPVKDVELPCNEQFGDPGTTNIIFPSSGRNCPLEQINCGQYRIKANHLQLTTQMMTNDGIKQALLQYGPIMMWFSDGGAIHSGDHAYVLYGWENQNGTTMWKLRDSWPCNPRNDVTSNINIAAIFSDNSKPHHAYAITSVDRENWNGSEWQRELKTVLPFELEQGKQSALIAKPANACLNQGQYTIATSLPAGSSITGWALRGSSFDATISSTGVLSGTISNATVVATLRRANGLLEYLTLPVGDVGIPHTVETQSYCPYPSQREIDLRLYTGQLPGFTYTQAINIPPSPDGSYYTIGNGTWFVHLVSRKTQAITYGTTVTATQNGNPACSRTITVPNRHVVAMPCSYNSW